MTELSKYDFDLIVKKASERAYEEVRKRLLPLLSNYRPTAELIRLKPYWTTKDISFLYRFPRKSVYEIIKHYGLKPMNGSWKRLYDPRTVISVFGEVPKDEDNN